jgi:hypothetical protein
MQRELWKKVVIWPVMVSRPDALCAMGILAQFVQNLGKTHWDALMRVITYLNTTKGYWLTFGHGANQLEGYLDADWASQTHRHSISGYWEIIISTGSVW